MADEWKCEIEWVFQSVFFSATSQELRRFWKVLLSEKLWLFFWVFFSPGEIKKGPAVEKWADDKHMDRALCVSPIQDAKRWTRTCFE